jgi:hypothetical protein
MVMAHTVKQVAEMSGVSVRMLHFYDEIGLLIPAYHGSNGYRYYNEPQLLTLQQILFYWICLRRHEEVRDRGSGSTDRRQLRVRRRCEELDPGFRVP